jgi:NADPH2:quinone reductase
MRLIQFREPGPPAVMQCLDVPIPEPASGEVLIRAHAIGVGMPDCLIRAGTYSVMPPLPATPGTELAGVIEKVGPSVTTRQQGQRVYTTARERPHRGGHYAEYVATPAQRRSPTIRSLITFSTMLCAFGREKRCSYSPPPVAWGMP